MAKGGWVGRKEERHRPLLCSVWGRSPDTVNYFELGGRSAGAVLSPCRCGTFDVTLCWFVFKIEHFPC